MTTQLNVRSAMMGSNRSFEFALMEPRYRRDPYELYGYLRGNDPIHRTGLGNWVFTRYRDIEAILKDPRFGPDVPRFWGYDAEEAAPIRRLQERWLPFLGPPDHARLRALISRGFSNRAITSLRPSIVQSCESLLDAIDTAPEFDLIHDFAYHLPVATVCQLMGIPLADRVTIEGLSFDVARTLDPVMSQRGIRAAAAAAERVMEYCREAIQERRRAPRDDFISVLLSVEDEVGPLTEADVLSNCVFLFGAAHNTSMNLIGNAMLALLTWPDELRRLRADLSRARGVVEETLRFDSPFHFINRAVREPVEIGHNVIRPGESVLLILASANRDPERFDRPDDFDPGRTPNPHLSFGGREHYCLGAGLARLQAQIAITAIVTRFPRLRQVPQHLRWRSMLNNRGLRALRVGTCG